MAKCTTDNEKKYVESAKLENIIIDGLNSGRFGHDAVEILSEIYALESADVAEVVRCRDCEKRYTDECPMHFEEECWHEERWYDDDGWAGICYIPHDFTHDDGFCDKWERRK